jgi:signal transduction histidine kinase
MTLEDAALAVGLDAAAAVLLGFAAWTAVRSREKPSAVPFAALLGTLTVWALTTTLTEVSMVVSVPFSSSVVPALQIGAVLLFPYVWVVYALGYTGRGIGLTKWRVVLLLGLVAPLVAAGVVLLVEPSQNAVEGALVGVVVIELLLLFVLFTYGTYLVVSLGRTHERVSKLHVALLAGGGAAPYVVSVVGSSGTAADGSSVGLFVAGLCLSVATVQFPLLTGFPKTDYVARERVVEDLQEAVFVVDWDGRVLDANETAGRTFDGDPDAMVGAALPVVVAGLDGVDLSAGAAGTTTLGTTRGRRQFQYSVSAVGGRRDGDAVARTVLLRDVTDRETREQRLTVLNRVLRHNLRNELDVVLAHANRIDDEETRTTVREGVADVVALSTKARDAEQIMTARTEAPRPVDLAAVATGVVERHRDPDSAAAVTLRAPDELVVTTHRSVVERVLSELVENALTHAGEAPAVVVAVDQHPDGAVELTVADDGPGVPERERRLIADGTETQLEHGSGIGLWLVNWGVVQLGGDLRFAESDRGGAAVTVRLYR